jgi:hypothetical protein
MTKLEEAVLKYREVYCSSVPSTVGLDERKSPTAEDFYSKLIAIVLNLA